MHGTYIKKEALCPVGGFSSKSLQIVASDCVKPDDKLKRYEFPRKWKTAA
jgi:hypothetical protein